MTSASIRTYLAGLVTAMDTIPVVVVGGGTGGTHGRELALDIGDAGM